MPINGRVIGLHLLIEHQQRPEPVRRARALVDLGLEGDVHGKKKAGSHRQVLIVDRATLEALAYSRETCENRLPSNSPRWTRCPPAQCCASERPPASSPVPANRVRISASCSASPTLSHSSKTFRAVAGSSPASWRLTATVSSESAMP